MVVRALPNPARGVPGIVVLPTAGYRRACAEPLLQPGAPPQLLPLDGPGLGAVRVLATAGFEARAGAYVALGLLAAELSRRRLAATLAELDRGVHAAVLRGVGVTCAGSPAFARGAAAAAKRAGAEALSPPGAGATLIAVDHSEPGLTEPPRQAMQALRLAVDAALDAWTGPPPTHALVAAERSALAAAASVQLRARLQPAPAVVLTAVAATATRQDRLGPLAWQELERGAAGLLLGGDGCPRAALGAVLGADGADARADLGFTSGSRVLILESDVSL